MRYPQEYNEQMSKYTDYQIVAGRSPMELTNNVLIEMNGGWQPIGGVAATPDSLEQGAYESGFYQAMGK